MHKTILGLAGLTCLATACAASAATGAGGTAEATTPVAEAPTYPVVIARPVAAGQRVRIEVTATQGADAFALEDSDVELDLEGMEDQRQVTLAGALEVLEVDAQGQVHRAELQVETFRDDLAGRELLPPGSKLLATRDGNDFAVVVDGHLPSEDLAPWLRLAFPLSRPGGRLVSDALSPSEPKAVGETWEVSKSAVVTDLAGDGYQTTESSITGKVTLLGTPDCGTGPCLELAAQLRAEAVTLSESAGLTATEAGVVEGSARLLLPMDPDRPVFLEDTEGTGTFVVELDDGEDGTIEHARVQVTRRRVATYTPIP